MIDTTRANCRCGIPYRIKGRPADVKPRCPLCGLPLRVTARPPSGPPPGFPHLARWVAAVASSVVLAALGIATFAVLIRASASSPSRPLTAAAPIAVAPRTDRVPDAAAGPIGPILLPVGPVGGPTTLNLR
jgi:hypothetical protein